jgi:hypothetical protein
MGNRLAVAALPLLLVAACTTTPSVQAATASPPAGIAKDCSRNVTADLNTWIGSVPDGSTLLLARNACYRVDGTLRIVDRHNLTIGGNGATVRAMSTPPATPKITRQMFEVRGGSGITIRNLTAWGTNPSPTFNVDREWFPLFEITGVDGVLLDRVTGRGAWGDFVFVGADVRKVTNPDGTGGVPAEDVTVRDSSATTTGRHGITCDACDRLAVTGTTFTDIGYQVLDIEVEAATWHARDIQFTGNTIRGRYALSVVASGDNLGGDIARVTVSGNTQTTDPVSCAPPVDIRETPTTRSDITVTGNTFRTLSNAARIAGVTRPTVDDNTVTVGAAGCTNSGVAVVVHDVTGASLRNNYLPGAARLAVTSGAVTGVFCGKRLSPDGPPLPGAPSRSTATRSSTRKCT